MIIKYNTYNEGIRDMMTPISDDKIAEKLPFGLFDIYTESQKMGWDVKPVFNPFSPVSLPFILITFTGKFKVAVFKPDYSNNNLLSAEFMFVKPTSVRSSSGDITNFSDLERKITKILSSDTFTNESIRDKMTSTPLSNIVDKMSHMKELELYRLLWKTALDEDEDTLKLYLDNGADINIKNSRNETLLMDFVRTNDYVIVKMLLRLGADPNIGNESGYTPLVLASKNETESLVELLLLCDKLNPKKHDQLNVALKFARDRNEYVEKMLRSYKDKTMNESLRDKMTPKSKEEISNSLKDKSPQEIFQIGVNLNDSEMVEYAYKDTFNKNKNIAVLYPEQLSMIVGNKIDVIKVILKYQPGLIYSLVKTAIADGFTNKIKTLLDLVDPPKQENLDKLLVYCCSFNISDAVKILVELGANIHINNEEPLMNAVFAGNRMVVQELLKFGADPTVSDNRPIEEAKRRKHFDIASVMKSYVRKQPLKKRLSKYIPFLRESLRDKMTPKSEEDIKYTIKGMVETEPERFFKHEYLERSYDYDTLSKFVTDKEIFNGLLKMCKNIPPLRKGDSVLPKEKLARMMLYLFKNDYIYTETDSLGISWFKHNGKSRHGSEYLSVSGYTIMDNLKMYIKRAKE